MHEYSIVQSLVDSVERSVWSAGNPAGGVVQSLKVRIGEIAGVDTYLLATAFEVFRAGTICENATMEIESVPVRWVCPKCASASATVVRCTTCNEPATLETGDEIILQSIEMEVRDV